MFFGAVGQLEYLSPEELLRRYETIKNDVIAYAINFALFQALNIVKDVDQC